MKQAEAVNEMRDLEVVSRTRARAVHTRTAVLGLAIVAAALAFVAIRLTAAGVPPAEVAPIAVFAVITLTTAGLAWRFGAWAKILAAVVALALLLMYLPFIMVEIRVPQSFFDFVPTFAALVGCLTAIGGAVAAFIRRRDRRAAASPGERRVAAGVILGLAAVIALSGILAITSRTTVSAEQRAGAGEVVMADFEFTESVYRAAAGQGSGFVVANRDSSWHTFTIDELGIDVTVLPGSEALVEIPASTPAGSYTLYCFPHSSVTDGQREGMVATLEVSG